MQEIIQLRQSRQQRGRCSFLLASATVNITPTRPLTMGSGPSVDQVISRSVADEPLEANILFLRNPHDEKEQCLLVSLDLLYPGDRIRSAITHAAPFLSPEQILVAASHTHRAPMTCTTRPSLGEVDEDYISDLCQRLTAAIKNSYTSGPWTPVYLRIGQAQAQHSINRRLFKRFFLAKRPKLNYLANAPNPEGPTDETVTAAEFCTEDGQAAALIWNYACHPVSHPEDFAYSAHYPGVVRTFLREKNPDLPVIFLQGFSGNTRPRASAHVHNPKEILRRIVSGPLFDTMTWPSYRKWTHSLHGVVLQALSDARSPSSSSLRARRITCPANAVATYSPAITFQRLSIGESLTLIGVSGEPVAEYALAIRRMNSDRSIMCVGCIDEPAGYIPTDQMIDEGGYESDRSRIHFGVGDYFPNYQKTIDKYFENVISPTRGENTDA